MKYESTISSHFIYRYQMKRYKRYKDYMLIFEREREREMENSWTSCGSARVRSTLKGLWLASELPPSLCPSPQPPLSPLPTSARLLFLLLPVLVGHPVSHPRSHPTTGKTTLPPAAILLSLRPGLAKL